MSDVIYCPICDRRTGLDEASYVDYLPDEARNSMKQRYKLEDNDMVCMECEENYEIR